MRLIAIFATIIFLYSQNVFCSQQIKIKIGLSSIAPQKRIKNAVYDISFIKAESDARVLNMLTTGQLNMAILPVRYAIKSLWYESKTLSIGLKLDKYFEYLVSLKSKESLNFSNIRYKKIGLVHNSGSELVLNQYLGHVLYTKQYLNSVEMEKILFDNNQNVDGVMLDSSAFTLLADKNKYNVIQMNAGYWVLVTNVQDKYFMKDKHFLELFSSIKYDLKELDEMDKKFIDENQKHIQRYLKDR